MVGVGGIFDFNLLEPWVFPGRLIEVPVNADIAIHPVFPLGRSGIVESVSRFYSILPLSFSS
jgi:hypothetical protein